LDVNEGKSSRLCKKKKALQHFVGELNLGNLRKNYRREKAIFF